MNFEWFNITWLMQNLHWVIVLLGVSIIILFLFPVLLGHDLKKKADQLEGNDGSD